MKRFGGMNISPYLCSQKPKDSPEVNKRIDMKQSLTSEIKSLFDEFETNFICITDFGISYETHGFKTRIDYLVLNENKGIEIWSGNPTDDECAEELILSKAERGNIFREVLKNM